MIALLAGFFLLPLGEDARRADEGSEHDASWNAVASPNPHPNPSPEGRGAKA